MKAGGRDVGVSDLSNLGGGGRTLESKFSINMTIKKKINYRLKLFQHLIKSNIQLKL